MSNHENGAPPPPAWSIVLIDQEPLRQAARSRCQVTLAVLEKLRGTLTIFEQKDKPAFHRWAASEFGPLLTRARELTTEIQQHQKFVHDIEEEMRRSYCDPHVAYQRVRFGNTPPVETESTPPAGGGFSINFGGDEMTEEERATMFRDWLRENFGVNPEQLDEPSYERAFQNFCSRIWGEVLERFEFPNADGASSVDARVKQLYRILVRRLHPDKRSGPDLTATTLWHEAQQAYAARNVERLETLVALTEVQAGRAEATSLFQLRAVQRELRQALRALRHSTRVALTDHAWNFSSRGADENLRERVRQELEEDLQRHQRTLDYLTQAIAQWSTPAVQPVSEAGLRHDGIPVSF
ncbi:MAG: J domain-containing protein [Verrucomicrobiota bacterium]